MDHLSGAISGDPLLGTLANNGGPTFTMALLTGSPAIAVGDATISNAAPINALDQRGFNRSSTAPSIGAYEFNGTAPAPTVTNISPATGSTAGGTAITITGTDFTGATAVTIDGTAATNVIVVSSTSITATTPAGTVGTASVEVTTPSGTNAANTLFTYTAAAVIAGPGTVPAVPFSPAFPHALSITAGSGTATTSASFTVTFNQPVIGVDSTDFNLTVTGTVANGTISSATGKDDTYTLNVT